MRKVIAVGFIIALAFGLANMSDWFRATIAEAAQALVPGDDYYEPDTDARFNGITSTTGVYAVGGYRMDNGAAIRSKRLDGTSVIFFQVYTSDEIRLPLSSYAGGSAQFRDSSNNIGMYLRDTGSTANMKLFGNFTATGNVWTAEPTVSGHATTKNYVDTADSGRASLSGGNTFTGDQVFENTSSSGNATVGGDVVVRGASTTYGLVTASGGISGLVSAAKRTIYMDADSGSDSNGGTSWVDAYQTWAKVDTQIPTILKPLHNYSTYVRGTVSEALSLSDRVTPSSGIYLVGDATQLDSGTVTSYRNNSYPDGMSRISDNAATFGNYSGDFVNVNSADYTIAYTNATSLYVYGGFAANPSGAFTVNSYDWIQQAQPITLSNMGNVSINRVRIRSVSGSGMVGSNSNIAMSGSYIHNCTTPQGRGVSVTACPSVTMTRVVSRANLNGFVSFGSTFSGNYCVAEDNASRGYLISSGGIGAFTKCDSTGNPTAYYYTNGATSGAVFSNCRAEGATEGILSDGNAFCKAISGSYVDACTTAIHGTTGGQVSVTGATTLNGGIAVSTTGVNMEKHGGLEGHSNLTFSNISTTVNEDSASFGYIDN